MRGAASARGSFRTGSKLHSAASKSPVWSPERIHQEVPFFTTNVPTKRRADITGLPRITYSSCRAFLRLFVLCSKPTGVQCAVCCNCRVVRSRSSYLIDEQPHHRVMTWAVGRVLCSPVAATSKRIGCPFLLRSIYAKHFSLLLFDGVSNGQVCGDAEEGLVKTNTVTTNTDILRCLVEHVPERQFLFFAPESSSWRAAWGRRSTLTCFVTPDSSVSQLRQSLECGLPRDHIAICEMLARLGKM